MLKPSRAFLGIVVSIFFLTAIPLSTAVFVRSSFYSVLKIPIALSQNTAQVAVDLFYFRKNAEQFKNLKRILSQAQADQLRIEELRQENSRLTKLLNLKQTASLNVRRSIVSRVIGRSPAAWNRAFLIDKGARQGVRTHLLVLSGPFLVGKIIEAGPSVSKVLLITDPSSKIGVLIQRTRQEGVLFGTSSGECRMKYVAINAELNRGDIVETAGFGGFFPKGLAVGTIERVWKEPGQIYQVAEVKPMADLNQIEEVVLVE